ncbi:MCE family protein [Actinoallomurus oryzae]|uniref:MCE family protein n=1 Tax=Actinoallomurus oryzae TaxID=502180 RepID=A0ABP8PAC5_9ACTN
MTAGSWSERLRYRLYGLVFMIIVIVLVLLMLAQYNQAFKSVYHVTVNSDRAGLQLVPHSDVKVRGLIVGEVRSIHSTATGAAIDLALDPGKAALIPDNSSARMLPKTVFGEKYVDLVPPTANAGPHLKDGDTIAQDKSTTAIEVNQVLDDIMPLLNAVKPEKLNATLNALATALQGRGEEIGQTIDLADGYLRKLNPHLPTIVHDLRALSTVSDNLNGAAPDLLSIMQNLQVTNKTIVDKQPQLVSLLDKGIDLTGKLIPFAEENEPRLVGAQLANRQALALIAKSSPAIPCVFKGMAKIQPRLVEAMGGGQPGVHVTLELSKPRPAYKPVLDAPENKDQRNARCYGVPNPKVPFPQYQTLDGTQDDTWWKGPAGRSLSSVLIKPGSSTDDDSMLKSLMAPAMGTSANQVSDLASLLYAPAASGMVVTLK